MSAVTITTQDKQMSIDGVVQTFDLGLDDNVWAIQWDGSKGHIEYTDGTPNKDIDAFPELDDLTAKHTKAQEDADKAEIAELKKVAAAMTYAEKRSAEYDKLNQFEMIYDDKINETTTWVDAIQAIKKTIPKPE